MDFSRVILDDDDAAFRDEVRATLTELVTDDVKRRNRATGNNLDIEVHLALGAKGWLAKSLALNASAEFWVRHGVQHPPR